MNQTARLTSLLLLCFSPLFALNAQAFFTDGQRPRFNAIDRLDGLPNNSVSSMFQDRRGLMWFGTQSGLARYDGHTFFHYHNEPFNATSLPHDLIQTVFYDEATDTVWVGTYGGLAKLNAGSSSFETFQHDPEDPSSLSDNVVIAITRGPDDRLWVGTQNGLNRMTDDGQFERIDTPDPIIRDLFVDSTGTLWIGTLAGLARWNPVSDRVEVVEGIESPYIMSIDELEPGILVLGTWELGDAIGGVAAYEIGTGEIWRRRFSTNTIYSVLAGSDGTVWAGSWGGGLFAITADGQIFEFTPETEENLRDPVIYSLFEDRAGLIWVGTNGGGIHLLSPRQRNFRAYRHEPDRPRSIPSGRVTEILRSGNGTLWVGTYGGGAARLAPGSDRWQRYSEQNSGLLNNIVNEIFEDHDGTIWIGTNGGLQRFDPVAETFQAWEDVYSGVPLSGTIVYAIHREPDGRYWIGTYRNGITRYDPASGERTVFSASARDDREIANDLIYDITQDSRGTVWISTNGGVSRYTPATETMVTYRHDPDDRSTISNNTVRTVLEDPQNQIWLATFGGGINRFNPGDETFTHITQNDGLPSNKIVSLLIGDDDRLWAGTQQGIAALDPADRTVQVLDEHDGLFGTEFNTGAVRDPDGTLLFGGAHGITRIDSAIDAQNPVPPPVHITDVQIFQHSVDPYRLSFNDATIELAAADSFVAFEFAALDFETVSGNTYRYRLAGFDEEWVDAGTRSFASYTNLPAGRYRLEVIAANPDGIWSPEPAALELLVRAPWYFRWWAIVLWSAILAGLAWVTVRAREAHVLSGKNRELEHAVSQLAVANQELERLSVHDSLTGIHNRRYFDAAISDEWNRARRTGAPLTVLMIDIDYFKNFNDRHGHVAGDVALKAVSTAMSDQLNRSTDFVARYGGEEFAAVLYETDTVGGRSVAERIRLAVAATPIGEDIPRVTVSIGAATMVPENDDVMEIVNRADRALYLAKERGRNCVILADATEDQPPGT